MDANEYIDAGTFRAKYCAPGPQMYRGRRHAYETPAEPERDGGFRHESDFQGWVSIKASLAGWQCYHTHSSKRSEPGFPDTVLVHPPYECIAELKMFGMKPTRAQVFWLDQLARVRQGSDWMYVCVWYPEMRAAIETYLDQPEIITPPGIWAPSGDAR